jgi:amino acid transporter
MGRPIKNRKAQWSFAIFTITAAIIFGIIISSGLIQLAQTGRVITPDGTIREGNLYWISYGVGLMAPLLLALWAFILFRDLRKNPETK